MINDATVKYLSAIECSLVLISCAPCWPCYHSHNAFSPSATACNEPGLYNPWTKELIYNRGNGGAGKTNLKNKNPLGTIFTGWLVRETGGTGMVGQGGEGEGCWLYWLPAVMMGNRWAFDDEAQGVTNVVASNCHTMQMVNGKADRRGTWPGLFKLDYLLSMLLRMLDFQGGWVTLEFGKLLP